MTNSKAETRQAVAYLEGADKRRVMKRSVKKARPPIRKQCVIEEGPDGIRMFVRSCVNPNHELKADEGFTVAQLKRYCEIVQLDLEGVCTWTFTRIAGVTTWYSDTVLCDQSGQRLQGEALATVRQESAANF